MHASTLLFSMSCQQGPQPYPLKSDEFFVESMVADLSCHQRGGRKNIDGWPTTEENHSLNICAFQGENINKQSQIEDISERSDKDVPLDDNKEAEGIVIGHGDEDLKLPVPKYSPGYHSKYSVAMEASSPTNIPVLRPTKSDNSDANGVVDTPATALAAAAATAAAITCLASASPKKPVILDETDFHLSDISLPTTPVHTHSTDEIFSPSTTCLACAVTDTGEMANR